MKYYMNKTMVDLIRKTPYKRITLPIELRRVLNEGLIIHSDCLFFYYFYNANSHLKEEIFVDKTQYEHFVNEIHFDDFCRKCSVNHIFVFANQLKKKLNESGITLPIRIVVSSDNGSISMSFSTKHEGEKPWIDIPDIDSYRQPIMIIEA